MIMEIREPHWRNIVSLVNMTLKMSRDRYESTVVGIDRVYEISRTHNGVSVKSVKGDMVLDEILILKQ